MKMVISFTFPLFLIFGTGILLSVQSKYSFRYHQQRRASFAIVDDVHSFTSFNFTHLIVGGGTAGMALAARLSEQSDNFVGVLEAGSAHFDDPINAIPARFGGNLNTQYDWNYTSTPSASGVPSLAWPRGRVLGGSSVLNFLVWDRASTIEYDAWEQLGNRGWNGKTLHAYMRKAESVGGKILVSNESVAGLGQSGPVKISFPQYVTEYLKRWIPAMIQLGLPVNVNPLNGRNGGASIQPSDIDPSTGLRSSAATAYYVPNAQRANLKILTDATASKVLFFSSETRKSKALRATGVQFVWHGSTYTINATKEVVLSCGTVDTPKLLELSGIGRKEVLSRAGVTQLVQLEGVGENLQDHTRSSIAFELQSGTITLDTLRNDPGFAAQQMTLFQQQKPSLYATGTNAISYWTLPQLFGIVNDVTNVQAMLKECRHSADHGNLSLGARITLLKQIEFLRQNLNDVSQMEVVAINGFFVNPTIGPYADKTLPKVNTSYITLTAAQQHLFSRGSVHITASDVNVKPSIVPNYFSNAFDRRISAAGTALMKKIGQTTAFTDGFVRSVAFPRQGADLQKYTETNLESEYHPIGTASMLPFEHGGVVDRELRVYKTSNLRIVDASIIPLHVSAHLQATVYGIAEIAADMMKGKDIA